MSRNSSEEAMTCSLLCPLDAIADYSLATVASSFLSAPAFQADE
jgi:hypothetical protein